jgi:bacteriorhodopsin
MEAVKYSFTITYIFLLTTATITFIEAMRTSNTTARHILNIETAISLIAGYFYSLFVEKINTRGSVPYNEITVLRYVDWAMTTPLMLLVLAMFLSTHVKKELTLSLLLTIVGLDFAMLYAGYLGEVGQLERWTAWGIGFLAFFGMFGLLYNTFLSIKCHLSNYVVFSIFVGFWSLYGVFYLTDEVTKNVGMNMLDLFAKCFVGIGLWAYFSKIFVLG